MNEELIWQTLKPKIDSLITRRIILFHDALVERGQISELPPAEDVIEDPIDLSSHYTEDCAD